MPEKAPVKKATVVTKETTAKATTVKAVPVKEMSEKEIAQKIAKYLTENPSEIEAFQKKPSSTYEKLGLTANSKAVDKLLGSFEILDVRPTPDDPPRHINRHMNSGGGVHLNIPGPWPGTWPGHCDILGPYVLGRVKPRINVAVVMDINVIVQKLMTDLDGNPIKLKAFQKDSAPIFKEYGIAQNVALRDQIMTALSVSAIRPIVKK